MCAFRSIARPGLGPILEGESVLNISVFDDFQKKNKKNDPPREGKKLVFLMFLG